MQRIIWILLAAAALALASPAAAHDLKLYKVEKQVDLESDDETYELGCLNGDPVLDGMWRIDHADQDPDDLSLSALARSADVLEARAIDNSTYRFHFVKWAIGRVQLKLFVTCIGKQTAPDGHQHPIKVGNFKSMHWQQWNNQVLTFDGDYDVSNGVTEYACPSGWWAVTPGFVFTSPTSMESEPGFGRVFESRYSDYRMRSWSWGFQFGQSGGEVDTSLRCLRMRVDGNVGERHRLIARYLQYSPTARKHRNSTGKANCSDQYKALVSGFAIDPSLVNWGLNHPDTYVWFLGMDPQIKSRVFTVTNKVWTNYSYDTRTLCLNDRTS